jgi:hypothetical protein
MIHYGSVPAGAIRASTPPRYGGGSHPDNLRGAAGTNLQM